MRPLTPAPRLLVHLGHRGRGPRHRSPEQGRDAAITSVSCVSAGNCGAGGSYTSGAGIEALVIAEADGTWGAAEEVPGTATLYQGGSAAITSVSCTSAVGCSAGGWYRDGVDNRQQAFVVNET
jgi:hypothetical protein